MDKRIYLKIKIKSLAAEARIIRREERRCRDQDLRNGLTEHRRRIVRPEARATLIAYGYLNGKAYRSIEPKADKSPDWAKVKSMVTRYGSPEAAKAFDAWVKEGTTVLV